MILEALSIGLALLGQAPVATNGDTAKVALLQQNIGTVEAAARGAKSKSGDAQASAAIEKKYAETATALDAWRIAALATTQKEWSSSRERIEDLSRAVARSCAEFGRDARAYPNGVPSGIDSNVVSRTATRFLDAAQVLARSDEDTKKRLAGDLSLRPWSEVDKP